ncbi:hypothetical protein MHTCC0001_26820 [Flavobacteriaceae bacterium MHTCC 0001]
MLKNFTSIILSILFMLIVAMPTIMMVIDNSLDVSMFYTTSEEEKDKSQEKNKEKDFIVFDMETPLQININDFEDSNLEYYSKIYKKPHIKHNFPPPRV